MRSCGVIGLVLLLTLLAYGLWVLFQWVTFVSPAFAW